MEKGSASEVKHMRDNGMREVLQNRADRLFMKIDELGIEAALILNMKNIRYLTGFTGSEGALLAGKRRMCLFVDGRYTTQARSEALQAEVFEFKQKIPAIAQVVNEGGVVSIAFEASAITYQQYIELADNMPQIDLKPLGVDISGMRAIKEKYEIDLIRRAAGISGSALESIRDIIKPGISERELAAELEHRMRTSGSEGVSFETIVASGENSALPHAQPTSRRLIEGDFVIFDYGSVCGGYHSDETCTFGIGKISAEQKEIYGIVKEAHDRAISQVKHGVPCKLVDETARTYIDSRGFGLNFVHGTGHGVGLEVHEFPRISFLGDDMLESGMVVTIEPGIYIPGSFGIRLESLILVLEDGCEVLSQIDKKLNIID